MYNYAKLKGKIREVYGTNADFARAMNLSTVSISQKLNNRTPFTQPEIDSAIGLLEIDPAEIKDYFLPIKLRYLNLMVRPESA